MALATIIRDGLFNQSIKNNATTTDTVDSNEENEQFTIIEKAEGE